MRIGIRILAIAITLVCTMPGGGDVVELKDGTRIEGTYAGGTPQKLRIDTASGVREVARGEVVSIRFADPTPPAEAAAARVEGRPAATTTIPAGSLLLVRMQNQVSSKDAEGKKFAGVLETDVRAGNTVVARAGTKVYGRVESSKQAGRMVGKSSLRLGLTDINLNGANVPIATSDFSETGQGSFRKTARNTLVGTGVGSAFGEAGAGAAIGAGVSVIREGQSVTVSVNAILEFRLVEPVQVAAAAPK